MRSTEVFPSRSRARTKKDSTTITFGLLREDHQRVLECALLLDKSISGICREALSQYLNSPEVRAQLQLAIEGGEGTAKALTGTNSAVNS